MFYLFIYFQTSYLLVLQIDFSQRFEEGAAIGAENKHLAVDTFDVFIYDRTNKEESVHHRNPKNKQQGLKYEVGVGLYTGKIYWLAGGLPATLHNDIGLWHLCGMEQYLEEGEMLFGDKISPQWGRRREFGDERTLEFNKAVAA